MGAPGGFFKVFANNYQQAKNTAPEHFPPNRAIMATEISRRVRMS